MSKTAKAVTASVAVVAFAVAAAFGSFALAQDGTGDATATAQDGQSQAVQQLQSQDGQSSTDSGESWMSQANGTVDKLPDEVPRSNQTDADQSQSDDAAQSQAPSADANAQQSSAQGGQDNAQSDGAAHAGADDSSADSSDDAAQSSGPQASNDASADAQAAADQPAAQADAADCNAVTTWDELKACVPQSGAATITITQPIDAATLGPITIPAGVDVTLTAVDDLDHALTASTGDALFIVNGTLTIGKGKDDASFSYKTGKRWLALVNDGGSLTINNGTFSGVDTTGTGYANGGLVKVNAGAKATVINNGTFSNNKATRGSVIYSDSENGIAIHGGTFDGNSSGLAAGVIMQNSTSATMTIDAASGTAPKFTNNSSINSQGGAIHNKGTLTIDAGEFTGNKAKTNGGVISQDAAGSIAIHGGTFSKNTTQGAGGAIYKTNGDLTITGGEFSENLAYGVGGGAIGQDGTGSTFVTPADGRQVTFTGNGVTFDEKTLEACKANSVKGAKAVGDKCHRGIAGHGVGGDGSTIGGGGAILGFGGKVSIQGNVKFDGNYSNPWGFRVGGGAIYMRGELWVQNDVKGNKPQFLGNYAGVAAPEKDANGKVTLAYRGGAGGAIFLDEGAVTGEGNNKTYASKAYIMGGNFANNVSGYLGGAIYTEINSVTYVAKATASGNTAGHFGGGLWLCPSGTGEASKGGNIALFDNKVDKNIDPNTDNDNPASDGYDSKDQGTGTEAGDDFAIMNPYHKTHPNTNFMLMDTWFTDRTKAAVDWYHDGVPVRNASGYDDSYQNPNHDYLIQPGTNVSVTMKGDRSPNGGKIDDLKDDTKMLTLGQAAGAEYPDTGVALKAIVKDQNGNGTDDEKANAIKSAAVTMTGNVARLSGGAFGTDGDVKFSTPYTASWTKVEMNAAGVLTDKEIAGAEWELTTADGGPYSADFYPGMCAAGDAGAAAWANGTCWKDKNGTKSLIIKDNMGSDVYVGVDNNPDGGGFDINNLASGVYTLTERKAPTGYTPDTKTDGTAKTYTFDVTNAQGKWRDDNGGATDNTEKHIGNKPLPGVSWAKMDSTSNTKVGGSEWEVTMVKDAQGNPVTNAPAYKVVDCVDSDTAACKDGANDATAHTYADKDGTAGSFTIDPDADGTYKLVESKAPANYWQPADGTAYYFTIKAGDKDAMTVIHQSEDTADANTEVKDNAIYNTPSQVAWSKIAATDQSKLLSGSEWTISGPYLDKAGTQEVTVGGNSITSSNVPVTDCHTNEGALDPCGSHTNTTDQTTGKVTEYKDIDPAEGKLRVRLMAVPSDAGTYYYKLTETKQPDGYVLPKGVTYTFAINARQPGANGEADANKDFAGQVKITATDGVSQSLQVVNPKDAQGAFIGENLIPNVGKVNALPFTGGRAARDWAIVGGVFALGAGLAYALVTWYRNRKGLGL